MSKYVVYNNQTKKKELLVEECLKDFLAENPIIIFDGVPSIYIDGVYEEISQGSISNLMFKFLPFEPKERKIMIEQTMDYISAKLKSFKKIESHKLNQLIVAFNDKAFDVLTGCLIDYNPDVYIKQKLPFDYNPNANRDFMNQAISVWANNDSNIEALIQEMIGSAITNSFNLRKAFMLVGPKNDGKSALLEVMEHLVGEENCSHISLKEMKKDTYVASLNGKLLNCADDIDDKAMHDTSVFKNIVSHGNVTGKFLYKNPFSFKPYCTLIFSANSAPYIKDRTGDIKKRLIVIPFNNNLTVENSARLDNFLFDAIEEENLQALANIGIEALARLAANRFEYSSVEKSEDSYDQMLIDNDPAFYFVSNVITKADVLGNTPAALFGAFNAWRNDNSDFDGEITQNMFSRIVCNTYAVKSENHSDPTAPNRFQRIYIEK